MINKLYIISSVIIILIFIITLIESHFKTVEEFTTIYGPGYNSNGIYGINCAQCPDGQEPSDDLTSCQLCQAGTAGTGGTCEQCPDGTQPADVGHSRTGGTECESCPGRTAGTGGDCQFFCGQGFWPNYPEKTRCVDLSDPDSWPDHWRSGN